MVTEVIPTRVQLSFSQLQNFIADVAIERGYDYYFWGHADVALMASNATTSFTDEILGWAARLMHFEAMQCLSPGPGGDNTSSSACRQINIYQSVSINPDDSVSMQQAHHHQN